nr:MAG TPA: hypothetical protein [Caudoviricetes sp.]
MKFFDIDEEYLKKGGLITRDKKSVLAYGIVDGRLVAFKNGIKIEPEKIFKGYVADLLANDWDYISYQQIKKWKPNDGDFYYYVSSTGHLACERFLIYSNDDNNKLAFNNVFKTAQEAKKMLEKLKIINRLRELSTINFGEDINQLKYSIGYDIVTKKVCSTMNRFTRNIPFEVYFETAKDCQNAIDEIGEENLKKYYFDVFE